jgi:hypothetical protein
VPVKSERVRESVVTAARRALALFQVRRSGRLELVRRRSKAAGRSRRLLRAF